MRKLSSLCLDVMMMVKNNMQLLGIEVTLHLYYVDSLKEKRRIIRSILDHTHHRFQISTAEIGYLNSLGRSSIGFGIATNNLQNGEKILQKVINYIDEQSAVEIIDIQWLEA